MALKDPRKKYLTNQAGIRGVLRFKKEQTAIVDHMENLGLDRLIEDRFGNTRRDDWNDKGIRCLAQMRDEKLSDDVKKLAELLQREPTLKEADEIRAESWSLIKQKYPMSSSFAEWWSPSNPPKRIVPVSHEQE